MAGLVAVWAGAQTTSGGSAAGGSAASAESAASANAQQGTTGANAGVNSSMNNSVNSSVNTTTPNQNSLPPGLQRDQLPPGLANRDQLPPGLNRGSSQFPPRAGAAVGETNNNPIGTTRLTHTPGSTPEPVAQTGDRSGVISSGATGTNTTSFGAVGSGVVGGVGTGVAVDTLSNRVTSGVTPTGTEDSRTYATNAWRRTATNSLSSPQVIRQDQAATDEDRILLVQVRRQVTPVITRLTQGVSSSTFAPVHFDIRNGTVTLVGMVPSVEQREQLVTTVEGIPGVVRVVDRLQLASSSSGNVAVGGSGDTNEVSIGTGSSGVVSNNAPLDRGRFGTSITNLPPTSSTNRVYENRQGLPPGLEKRDELPPGLQNRETLPPGLQRRVTPEGTNNPAQGTR